MAMSGTYVAEVPLKGSAEKHYKSWKSENHLFPDAVGHHIQGVNLHHGDWDSHGSIRSWNYTCDGKQELFKEKRELDDANMVVTLRGVEGHVIVGVGFHPETSSFGLAKPSRTASNRTEPGVRPKASRKLLDGPNQHPTKRFEPRPIKDFP